MRWVLVLAFVGRVWADEPPPLKIEDAVHLAETRNERGRIADLNVEVSAAGVEKARAAFLPVLAAGASGTLRPFSPPSTATGSVSLNQPILDVAAIPLYHEAKDLLAAQIAQSTDDRRQLAFDAARAFFNVLLAEQVVASANEKLATAQANLDLTEDELKRQLVGANDVARAQIDLASSQREVAGDQANLANALVQLAFTIGAPVSGSLVAPDAILAAGTKPIANVDDLVGRAIGMRPDLAAKRADAAAAHQFALEPFLRMVPTISFVGNFSIANTANRNGNLADATAGLSLSWPIFDAGVRYADARSRGAQATIADLNAQLLTRSVDEQVRSAATLLAGAQQQLVAAAAGRDAARLSAKQTDELYRRGLAKAIELVDANEQRFVAEVNYSTAEFGVETAYLALRQAIGLDPVGTELP